MISSNPLNIGMIDPLEKSSRPHPQVDVPMVWVAQVTRAVCQYLNDQTAWAGSETARYPKDITDVRGWYAETQEWKAPFLTLQECVPPVNGQFDAKLVSMWIEREFMAPPSPRRWSFEMVDLVWWMSLCTVYTQIHWSNQVYDRELLRLSTTEHLARITMRWWYAARLGLKAASSIGIIRCPDDIPMCGLHPTADVHADYLIAQELNDLWNSESRVEDIAATWGTSLLSLSSQIQALPTRMMKANEMAPDHFWRHDRTTKVS